MGSAAARQGKARRKTSSRSPPHERGSQKENCRGSARKVGGYQEESVEQGCKDPGEDGGRSLDIILISGWAGVEEWSANASPR